MRFGSGDETAGEGAAASQTTGRIGVLGGAFNPPHLGHLICGQEARVALGLETVLVVPAPRPPHKPVEDDPGAEHRLELCRCAVAGDGRFEVCELEMERPGTSYTVDTLEELKSRSPQSELFLILGADAAAGLPSWREPKRILTMARLAVAERPGTDRSAVEQAIAEVGADQSTDFFPMPEIGISSTMVRDRGRAGKPLRYLVPEAVADYIERQGLYGGSKSR